MVWSKPKVSVKRVFSLCLELVSLVEKIFSFSIDLLLKEQSIEDKVGSFRPEMARSGTFRGAVNQFELNTLCNIGLETFDFPGKFLRIHSYCFHPFNEAHICLFCNRQASIRIVLFVCLF